MNEKDLKIVCGTRLFAGLLPDAVADLLHGSAPRTCPKGKMLFQQGDPANAFYIVLDGWVKVFRPSVVGDEAVFGVFTTGETFGEAAMFIQGQYPAAAQVVEDSRLIAVHSDIFRKRVRNDPDLAFDMLAAMSRHLHSLINQVEQLQTRSSAQRLAQFLVSLAPVAQGAAVVGLPYDKSLIAHRLGMKPESLSRAFVRLRARGVRIDGNRVMVSNIDQLREYGETGPLREPLASH